MENSNDRQTLGDAARWSARLAAHDCSAQERREFSDWMDADARHRIAAAQVAYVTNRVDQAIAADARIKQLLDRAMHGAGPAGVAAPEQAAARIVTIGRQVRRFVPLAMAASVAVVAFTVWQQPAVTQSETPVATTIDAPRHAAREITLEDGSVVNLDAGTKMLVSMSRTERRIELMSGRAWFDVAHDANRPFSVTANDTRTVALGTRFEVNMQGAQTVVTLAQGSVAIDGPSAPGTARWREQLRPGEQLSVELRGQGEALRARREVELRDLSSWTRGWLVFRDAPLAEAVRELNLYSEKQILLADASLADLTVGGRFIAGDSSSVVAALAELLPIRVVDGGSHEIMLFKRYDN